VHILIDQILTKQKAGYTDSPFRVSQAVVNRFRALPALASEKPSELKVRINSLANVMIGSVRAFREGFRPR
jgi:hypothetical protein